MEHDHDDVEESDEDGRALKAWWRERQQKRRDRRAQNVAMFDVYFDMRQRCGQLILRVDDAMGAWTLISNPTSNLCSCGGPPKYRPGQYPPDFGMPACELRSLEQWLTPGDKKWLKIGFDVICNEARTRSAAKMLYELLLGELVATRLKYYDQPRSIEMPLYETLMASKRVPHGVVVLEPRVWEKVWLAICTFVANGSVERL